MAADRLVRFVERAGWTACLGSIALASLTPGLARSSVVQWCPWLAGLLVVGIPHGALDHRVEVELRDGETGHAGSGFYVAYLGAFALVVGCWFVSPMAASLGFLAVAAGHFGQGDLSWSREAGLASRTDSIGYRASLIVSRSVLPIALPLLCFPGEFSGEAASLASRFFGRSGWVVPASAVAWGWLVVLAATVSQVAWACWTGWKGDRATRRVAVGDISQTLLLVSLFAIVPPVLALGVYFNAWHSLRHVARLMKVARSTRGLIESGRLGRAFSVFLGQALPMTAGALVLMAALGLAVGRGLATVADLGWLSLVFLSALTLPHVMVVAWMDIRQGVWSASSGLPTEEVNHVRI